MALEKEFTLDNGAVGNYSKINQIVISGNELVLDMALYTSLLTRQAEKPYLITRQKRLLLDATQMEYLYDFLYGIVKSTDEYAAATDIDPDEWKQVEEPPAE